MPGVRENAGWDPEQLLLYPACSPFCSHYWQRMHCKRQGVLVVYLHWVFTVLRWLIDWSSSCSWSVGVFCLWMTTLSHVWLLQTFPPIHLLELHLDLICLPELSSPLTQCSTFPTNVAVCVQAYGSFFIDFLIVLGGFFQFSQVPLCPFDLGRRHMQRTRTERIT